VFIQEGGLEVVRQGGWEKTESPQTKPVKIRHETFSSKRDVLKRSERNRSESPGIQPFTTKSAGGQAQEDLWPQSGEKKKKKEVGAGSVQIFINRSPASPF